MIPKVKIVSLGCSKNLVDSEKIITCITQNGGIFCDDEYEADVIVINTCGFINSAKEQSIDAILETSRLKEEGKCKKLIVTGCLAQRYKKDLLKAIPEIDDLVGINDFNKVADKVFFKTKEYDFKPPQIDSKKRNSTVKGDNSSIFSDRIRLTPKHYAYLKISDGCNNRCTYCTIPSIRGRHKSRSIEDIVNEAASLSANGAKELNIIAQDTTEYGIDLYKTRSLHILLKKISEIKDVKWIRLFYTHPQHIYDELIDEIANNDKICNYIDMPIQHINEAVLKKMGRSSTKEQISNLIDKLRSKIPDLVLRTSIIVGFPGETEKRFNELLDFVKSAKFEKLGAFVYSREEDTPAYKFNSKVSAKVKNDRFETLMSVQQEIVFKNNEEMVGKELDVLIEECGDLDSYNELLVDPAKIEKIIDRLPQKTKLWLGRFYGDAPEVDSNVIIVSKKKLKTGTFKKVIINHIDGYNLIGTIGH